MKHLAGRSLLALTIAVLAGCASSQQLEVETVWQQLLEGRRQFTGARGFATIVVDRGGRRSIDVGFKVGRDGNVEFSVMSPFGTSLGTIFNGEGELVIVNRSSNTYWVGRVEDLEEVLPLGGIEMEGLGYLLAGLPPHPSGWSVEKAGDQGLRARQRNVEVLVLPQGIASVTVGRPPMARARLDLPSRPPSRVTVVDSSEQETAQITISRIVEDDVVVERPSELDGYRRVDSWFAVIGR